MKYQYLLFDLDGTLVDTTEGVLKSAQHALNYFGIYVALEDLMPFFGPPLKYSFTHLYGLSDADADKAITIYLERYAKHGFDESYVFPQIPPLLKKLKNMGYKLGVATSKFEEHAVETLKKHDIADFFDHITGANIDETISKKHEVIDELLRRFDATYSKDKVLMIGDMKYDIEGAKKTGIDSFGIYTGTASKNEHEAAGATYIAYSFEYLEEKLLCDFIND